MTQKLIETMRDESAAKYFQGVNTPTAVDARHDFKQGFSACLAALSEVGVEGRKWFASEYAYYSHAKYSGPSFIYTKNEIESMRKNGYSVEVESAFEVIELLPVTARIKALEAEIMAANFDKNIALDKRDDLLFTIKDRDARIAELESQLKPSREISREELLALIKQGEA